MAPNGRNPTEDNGLALPRAHLHVALVLNEGKFFLVKPPLWPGKITLHLLRDMTADEVLIKQALIDMGWANPKDILEPVNVLKGYPEATET